MDYRLTTLENGLRVVTIRRPSRLTTAVRVYVRAGSRYDDKHPGKAHFVEHMLFSGTSNRSSHQIYSDIESIGGMLQANTTKEYTVLSAVVMDRYLGTALDVLADLLSRPMLPQISFTEFLKEKLVILEEIKQAQDTKSILWDKFSETLWRVNPIRHTPLGNMISLRDLEYQDVIEFHRERYTARNIVISICGDAPHEHLVEQVSQRLSHLPSGDEMRPLPVIEPPPSKQVVHMERNIQQTYLIMGVQTTDMKDESRYAVKLMDRLLGSGGSSRLFQRLREDEKCVYSVLSLSPEYEDTGCLSVHTDCSPDSVSKAQALILEEWEKLKSELVSDKELEAAKRIYEGTLTKECETNFHVAAIFGIEALLHKIEPPEESIRKIKAITKQDILDAANRYLNTSEYTIVTLGETQQ